LDFEICNLQSSFFLSPRHAQRCAKGVLPRRRGAFTLVELLAALGISLLLIAAVTASLDIYLRVTTTGQVAIERQQVTRALFDLMTRDVSSLVFRPATTTEAAAEDTGTESSTDSTSGVGMSGAGASAEAETTAITVQDPESAYATTSLGLVGDAQSLLLHVSRPLEDLSYAAPQGATSLTARTSDLLSVSYFLAEPGAEGLAGAVADRHSRGISDPTERVLAARGPAGLARLEGDRMAMANADEELDTAALAEAARVIAPEIATLTFRYFDGQEWVETWDSTAMERLPQAIEVTLGYRDAAGETGAPRGLSGVVPIGQTVRHVIFVPLCDPAAAGSAL
jgi:type II secretory pathway pseudopilin PulG